MRLLSSVADTQSSARMGISLEHDMFVYNTYPSIDTTRRFIINPDEILLMAIFPSPTAIYKHMNWFWTTDCILDRNRTCRKRVS
jgi:hypothetical protein